LTNFSVFFTLLLIFLQPWTIFSTLRLLSAWKSEFQDYLHQVFDLLGLKASLYTVHSFENVISSFFTVKLTSTLIGAKNWSISKKFVLFSVLDLLRKFS